MSKTTPTQRSLAHLKAQGYTAGIVEKFNGFVGPINPKTGRPVGIRQDFCGGIDLIAFKAGRGTIGVQACADSGGAGVAKHRSKLLAEPRMREWVASGSRLVIWAWAKRGARGERKLWTCREVELTIEDFATEPQRVSA